MISAGGDDDCSPRMGRPFCRKSGGPQLRIRPFRPSSGSSFCASLSCLCRVGLRPSYQRRGKQCIIDAPSRRHGGFGKTVSDPQEKLWPRRKPEKSAELEAGLGGLHEHIEIACLQSFPGQGQEHLFEHFADLKELRNGVIAREHDQPGSFDAEVLVARRLPSSEIEHSRRPWSERCCNPSESQGRSRNAVRPLCPAWTHPLGVV